MNTYGMFNNIENSSWNIMIEIKDGKVNLDAMTLSSGLDIGGRIFD